MKTTRNDASESRSLIEAYQSTQPKLQSLSEKLKKKAYSKWIGAILNSAVRDLGQVRSDMNYHATGSGMDSHTDEERDRLKSAISELEEIIRIVGSSYKIAGKMNESGDEKSNQQDF